MSRFKDKDYPKDTIGYHWTFAKAVFGKDSKAVKWLEDEARSVRKGMNEKTRIAESQVVYLLGQIEFKDVPVIKGSIQVVTPKPPPDPKPPKKWGTKI